MNTLDNLIFKDFHSPLEKIECGGCGLSTKRKEIVAEYGLCVDCYVDYCHDLGQRYEERGEDLRVEELIA